MDLGTLMAQSSARGSRLSWPGAEQWPGMMASRSVLQTSLPFPSRKIRGKSDDDLGARVATMAVPGLVSRFRSPFNPGG